MKPLFGAVRLGPMTAPRALWLTVLFAGLARTVHAAGPVVLCEPCDAGALGQCKPLPRDCAERVREPGCGCCLTCALREGQACGVYTGRCGAGLRCQHRSSESKPLLALLEGRGVCTRPTDTNPEQDVDPSKKPVEETMPTTAIPTVSQGCEVVQDTATGSGFEEDVQKPELESKGSLLHNKLSIIEMEKFKQSQAYKVEPVAKELYHNILKDNRDSKREYGPCRREMESVLMSLSISCVINPRVFRIPNCDRKGFYKKKQCRPSKGPNRGHCWCVDKYGQPLPGYEVRVGVWTSMDSLCRATRAKNIAKSTAISRKINDKYKRD